MKGLGIPAAWLLVSLAPFVSFAAPSWPRAPWPEWAQERSVSALLDDSEWASREEEAGRYGGFHKTLSDTYVYIQDAEKELALFREVLALHNEQGLEVAGDLAVSFTPGDEAIVLVHLKRAGAPGGPWEELPFDVQLEKDGKIGGMYIDERTVTFIPAGLGAGDYVDFAYLRLRRRSQIGPWDWLETLGGATPISSRRFSAEFPLGMEVRHVLRDSPDPERERRGERVRLVWNWSHLPAHILPSALPRSYEPFPAVFLSSGETWESLAQRYERIVDGFPIDPRVRRLAREIAASGGDPVAACARWIQENIRYVGLEISIHRMIPARPEETLRNGYGDCKDMSLLLVQMLRTLGKRAWPALVRTPDLGPIDEKMPSLSAFNHEIAAVERDGSLLFVDPTVKEAVPPWSGAVWEGERVLVASGEHGLVTVSDPPDAREQTQVRVRARFPHGETRREQLELHVETEYTGPALTAMRRRLLEGRRAELTADAASFFGAATGGLILTGMRHDYKQASEPRSPLVIRETLQFDGAAGRGDCLLSYLPPEIEQWLQVPTIVGRTHPLGQDHPRRTRVELSLDLPEGFDPIVADDWSRRTEHVAFSRAIRVRGRRLEAKWSAETLRDEVPVARLSEHAAAINDARLSAELRVCSRRTAATGDEEPGASTVFGAVAVSGLFFGGLGFFVGGRARRRRRPSVVSGTK